MTTPSLIVPYMKKLAFGIALLMFGAAPAFAQSTEFGVLFGGSRRFVEGATPATGTSLTDDSFSFSDSTIDVYYAVETDPGTMFKIKAGRINTTVAFEEFEGDTRVRRDVDGQVQHIEGVVEYRFSEAFGSTGLFAGVGLYRSEADNRDTTTDYGFTGGLTADFPLSRRYGIIAEAAYHWTRADFRARYVTVGAGLRFSF
ncbi:MAG TPA: outer membrane beta-barrel protein [Thermoanaerobaculia bacterium]|nr:outer membrane beta-barrel protein [Thermoanaerobaculia bacterium]